MKEDKTRQEYYNNVIREYVACDNTDELDDLILEKMFKGTAIHSMKNANGKIIDGTSFPFVPYQF